jgi:hypothetical protein
MGQIYVILLFNYSKAFRWLESCSMLSIEPLTHGCCLKNNTWRHSFQVGTNFQPTFETFWLDIKDCNIDYNSNLQIFNSYSFINIIVIMHIFYFKRFEIEAFFDYWFIIPNCCPLHQYVIPIIRVSKGTPFDFLLLINVPSLLKL